MWNQFGAIDNVTNYKRAPRITKILLANLCLESRLYTLTFSRSTKLRETRNKGQTHATLHCIRVAWLESHPQFCRRGVQSYKILLHACVKPCRPDHMYQLPHLHPHTYRYPSQCSARSVELGSTVGPSVSAGRNLEKEEICMLYAPLHWFSPRQIILRTCLVKLHRKKVKLHPKSFGPRHRLTWCERSELGMNEMAWSCFNRLTNSPLVDLIPVIALMRGTKICKWCGIVHKPFPSNKRSISMTLNV